MALIFDIVAFANPSASWTLTAAFAALVVGTSIAIISAVTGLVDWWDIREYHPARKAAFWHMLTMFPALGLFIINTIVHGAYLGQITRPWAGLGLSIAGNLLAMIGGYFGGVMIYDDGISVGRHRKNGELPLHTLGHDSANAKEPLPTSGLSKDYHAVAPEVALTEGGTLRIEICGTAIMLARSQGRIYAVQDFCTHRCGPLSEGAIAEGQVECPWHRSVFDLATGTAVQGPAKVDLKTYLVRVQQGIIHVRLDRAGFEVGRSGAGLRRPNPREMPDVARQQERDAAARRTRSDQK